MSHRNPNKEDAKMQTREQRIDKSARLANMIASQDLLEKAIAALQEAIRTEAQDARMHSERHARASRDYALLAGEHLEVFSIQVAK